MPTEQPGRRRDWQGLVVHRSDRGHSDDMLFYAFMAVGSRRFVIMAVCAISLKSYHAVRCGLFNARLTLSYSAHSSRIATARVQPADAFLIFAGKQAIENPVDGSASRLPSFSIWQ